MSIGEGIAVCGMCWAMVHLCYLLHHSMPPEGNSEVERRIRAVEAEIEDWSS